MLRYLESLASWPGISHAPAYNRGQGPTGIYTLLDGAPFGWLFPGHQPAPVVEVHAPDPKQVADEHQGASVGAKNSPLSRKNIVHVELRREEDVETALAVAQDVYRRVHGLIGAPLRPKLTIQQIGRAGEAFVAAEIHRRGGFAAVLGSDMPGIDILATDVHHGRVVAVQVKTTTSGSWLTSLAENVPGALPAERHAWVFVDLGRRADDPPSYYIVPDEEFVRIKQKNAAHSTRHPGKSGGTMPLAIKRAQLKDWRDRWDELGIFGEEAR
jgi:hypothetical protein